MYATGKVNGSGGTGVGGLAGINGSGQPGSNDANITEGYATGAVTSPTIRVGGLVGSAFNGTISQTFATGAVNSPAALVGGLIGANAVTTTVVSSYWDTITTGRATSAGGTGEITSALQSTLPGGFTPADWSVGPGVYPSFVYQSGSSGWVGVWIAGPHYANPISNIVNFGAVNLVATAGLTGLISKIYDGTTTATLTPANFTLSGVAAGDSVTLNTPAFGSYDTKNVGTGKVVAVAGLTLSGADAGGYSLASTSVSAAIGVITQKLLTAALTGSVSRIYDGTTAATLSSGNFTFSGLVAGDSVAISNTAGTYDTKNVGTGKTVSVAGLTLSGSDARNYSFASTSLLGAIGAITPAALTASLTGSVSKIYDGTTVATLSPGNYVLSGKVSDDSVTLNTPASGTFDTKNVGTGKTVSVAGFALSGTDAGNYSFAATNLSAAIGAITPAALTASLTGSVSKIYDTTTAATLSPGNYALTGKVSGDSVALNTPASGTYDNKNAGTGKTVSASGLAISGADAGNYSLASTSASGAVGVITKVTLGTALTGTVTKVFDGTDVATLAPGNYVLTGALSGDTVALNDPASGNYDDKNVGSGKTVSVSGLAVSGADAGNYALASTTISGNIGTITKPAVIDTVSAALTAPSANPGSNVVQNAPALALDIANPVNAPVAVNTAVALQGPQGRNVAPVDLGPLSTLTETTDSGFSDVDAPPDSDGVANVLAQSLDRPAPAAGARTNASGITTLIQGFRRRRSGTHHGYRI